MLFAKALGANVTAISQSDSKKADAEQMGATRCMCSFMSCYFIGSLAFAVIATRDGSSKHFEPYTGTLDLIICTVSE